MNIFNVHILNCTCRTQWNVSNLFQSRLWAPQIKPYFLLRFVYKMFLSCRFNELSRQIKLCVWVLLICCFHILPQLYSVLCSVWERTAVHQILVRRRAACPLWRQAAAADGVPGRKYYPDAPVLSPLLPRVIIYAKLRQRYESGAFRFFYFLAEICCFVWNSCLLLSRFGLLSVGDVVPMSRRPLPASLLALQRAGGVSRWRPPFRRGGLWRLRRLRRAETFDLHWQEQGPGPREKQDRQQKLGEVDGAVHLPRRLVAAEGSGPDQSGAAHSKGACRHSHPHWVALWGAASDLLWHLFLSVVWGRQDVVHLDTGPAGLAAAQAGPAADRAGPLGQTHHL